MVVCDLLSGLRQIFSGAANRGLRFSRSGANQRPLMARRTQRFHALAADTLEERLSPGNLAVGGIADSARTGRANAEKESDNSGRESYSNRYG